MSKFKIAYTLEKEIVLEAKNQDDACEKFWENPESKDADLIAEVEAL